MTASLEGRDLVKSFHSRTAVDGIDLQVRPGEIVGLLGPNGAGKTTTFKLLLGLIAPDSGSVSFGQPLDGLPLHRRARLGLGYLPQGPSSFVGMTCRDNLLALLEALKKSEPGRRADDLLTRFGLEPVASQKARTLSGGERRRLEFARALCSDPHILLCDEPFAGIDPLARADITEAIRRLSADDIGVLLTDHNVGAALETCDRIYLMVEGRILESGTPEEIRTSEKARRLYLGKSSASD